MAGCERTAKERGRREILTKDPSIDVETGTDGGRDWGPSARGAGGTVIIKCIREVFRNERVSPPRSDNQIGSELAPTIFGKHELQGSLKFLGKIVHGSFVLELTQEC